MYNHIDSVQFMYSMFFYSVQITMTQGIERIPDSLGYLILNEDGAVLSVSLFAIITCHILFHIYIWN